MPTNVHFDFERSSKRLERICEANRVMSDSCDDDKRASIKKKETKRQLDRAVRLKI